MIYLLIGLMQAAAIIIGNYLMRLEKLGDLKSFDAIAGSAVVFVLCAAASYLAALSVN
jgi:hypothetical protein